jgi:hypothetical protein
MQSFENMTGIHCGNVMVFPQGAFSRSAIRALQDSGFAGAVNSGHSPQEEHQPLAISDVIQPSMLSNGMCPLFLRKYVQEVRREDVAWNAFFGQPLLIVEHHEIFRDPSPLLELVTMINRTVPQVVWSSLETSLQGAFLVRETKNGVQSIRPYANSVEVRNGGCSAAKYVTDYRYGVGEEGASVCVDERVYQADNVCDGNVTFNVAPESSRKLTLRCHSGPVMSPQTSSSGADIKVHLRRRMSEVRDNYLSRNAKVMALAKILHQAIIG